MKPHPFLSLLSGTLLLGLSTTACRPDSTALAAKETSQTVPALVSVRAEVGFLGFADPSSGNGPWTIPLQTRSERRASAVAWMGEVEFLTTGLNEDATLTVQAVSHPSGTEVVQDERGLWQLGEPLPWGQDLGVDPLPWIRRDGEGQSVDQLLLPPVQEGQAWVLFPLESDWATRPPGR